MKKLFLIAVMALCVMVANAQELTFWHGDNVSGVICDGPDPDLGVKGLNVGFTACHPIKESPFAGVFGMGYVTRGVRHCDLGYIQLELGGEFNFIKTESKKVNLFTGALTGIMAYDDDYDNTEPLYFGWQVGIGTTLYKHFVIKIGWEIGFTNVFKGFDSKPYDFFLRMGYTI